MEKQEYTTRGGTKQYRPVVSERRMFEAMGDGSGFCLACGADTDGVEPDARRYECEVCGAPKVYGLSELLMMDLVVLQ
jgi:hypothetical protein